MSAVAIRFARVAPEGALEEIMAVPLGASLPASGDRVVIELEDGLVSFKVDHVIWNFAPSEEGGGVRVGKTVVMHQIGSAAKESSEESNS